MTKYDADNMYTAMCRVSKVDPAPLTKRNDTQNGVLQGRRWLNAL